MPPEFLVQRGTGRIYGYSDILATKDDMEPMDPKIAKVRIEQTRKNVEKRKAMAEEGAPNDYVMKLSELSVKLSALENEFDDLEKIEKERVETGREEARLEKEGTPKKSVPTEEELRQERIDKDPDVTKIKAMTTWDEFNDYSLLEFGEEIKKSKTNIEKLVKEMVDKRVERIEEE